MKKHNPLDKLPQAVYTVISSITLRYKQLEKRLKETKMFKKLQKKLPTKQQMKSAANTLFMVYMVFVLVSIAFSTYMVYFGSERTADKIMLAPQALFAAGLLIYVFSKFKISNK